MTWSTATTWPRLPSDPLRPTRTPVVGVLGDVRVEPFQWRFTTSEPDDLPARLDRRATDHQEESSAAQSA
ncbi:hypothetical protein DKM19_20050 [Streptosporangium sp. 'caverna']|nr:hypothetical protein DKM19_20050 [Streptosporangium sp. 'caverna']